MPIALRYRRDSSQLVATVPQSAIVKAIGLTLPGLKLITFYLDDRRELGACFIVAIRQFDDKEKLRYLIALAT